LERRHTPEGRIKDRDRRCKEGCPKRHEPLNPLKQEFCDFWDRGGKHKSRADAAGRFYASFPAAREFS